MQIPNELRALSPAAIAVRLGVTRQGVVVALRREQGLCPNCGRKASCGVFCKRHYNLNKQAQRSRTGHKPWKPGRRGRPPVTAKQERSL